MPQQPLTISAQTRRRFILGAQGLWPGRRWRGKAGILDAIRQMQSVQMDPVTILAPSHDINLWGRILDYRPTDLHTLLYTERRLFDYGGNLNIYPIEELPYWKLIMEWRTREPRWAKFAAENPGLIKRVLEEVKARGPLRKRDLAGEKIENYRGSKDTSLALYYLWLTGRLMSHDRQGRERVYDLTERIAPDWAAKIVPAEEARRFHLMKEIGQHGLMDDRLFRQYYNSFWEAKLNLAQARNKLAEYMEGGALAQARIEGEKPALYLRAEDLPLLESIHAGRIPAAWQPLDTTTEDEVVFLSPLERVSARGRAKQLFGFDYTWEIYKPEAKRVYGPYTLPVLFGDQLGARMDASLDRERATLVVNGLWLEDWFVRREEFDRAFARGLARFMRFLDAQETDVSAVDRKLSKLFS